MLFSVNPQYLFYLKSMEFDADTEIKVNKSVRMNAHKKLFYVVFIIAVLLETHQSWEEETTLPVLIDELFPGCVL